MTLASSAGPHAIAGSLEEGSRRVRVGERLEDAGLWALKTEEEVMS